MDTQKGRKDKNEGGWEGRKTRNEEKEKWKNEKRKKCINQKNLQTWKLEEHKEQKNTDKK